MRRVKKQEPQKTELPPFEAVSSHPLTGKVVQATILADKLVGRKRKLHVKGKLEFGDGAVICVAGKWWWSSNVRIAA